MMVQDTSYEAWLRVKETLTKKQNEIYVIILQHPNKTAAQYAQILVKPVNTISGRFGELRKLGMIVRGEKVQCPVTKGMAWTMRVI